MEKGDWDRISQDYYEEILSPIKNSLNNPLLEDLDKLKGNKVIADLGCGIGEIEKNLSKKFKEVYAMDFSKKMIEVAKQKNPNLNNVYFIKKDIEDLSEFHNKFDVVVSINAIISNDLKKIDNIFSEINKSLKDGGKFICVLPAMEVYIYQSLLIADREMEKTDDKKILRQKIRRFIKKQEPDFLLGMVNFDGEQKNYYRFEILWRLKKAGFKNIEIKKVFYPWEEFKKAGQSYFPSEGEPWDWYVSCEK